MCTLGTGIALARSGAGKTLAQYSSYLKIEGEKTWSLNPHQRLPQTSRDLLTLGARRRAWNLIRPQTTNTAGEDYIRPHDRSTHPSDPVEGQPHGVALEEGDHAGPPLHQEAPHGVYESLVV